MPLSQQQVLSYLSFCKKMRLLHTTQGTTANHSCFGAEAPKLKHQEERMVMVAARCARWNINCLA